MVYERRGCPGCKREREERAVLTVYNVGQGDALLIQAPANCVFDRPPLLVDTGPARAKVAGRLPSTLVRVLLTHSHEDHIGGFPGLIRQRAIGDLMLPYYLPEVTEICRFLGRRFRTGVGRPTWRIVNRLSLRLVGEGDRLCDHIAALNPPRDPRACFPWPPPPEGVPDIAGALRRLAGLGLELPVQEIVNYETPVRTEGVPGIDPEYRGHARVFVHLFFVTLSDRMGESHRDALDYHVAAHVGMAANQASIVFLYSNPGVGTWLFTGDADEASRHCRQ